MSKQTKQGARNSANDLKMIQQIHDGACALGAECATGKAVDVNRIVARVNELKAVYGDDPIEIAGRMAGGEAYDIAAAAQALAQLAVIAADEAFEDDFEPVQVGQIVNAMRWLLVFINAEIDELSDTLNVPMGGTQKRATWDAEADTLVAFGGNIKLLDNGHIGGYLVRFGNPNQTDLEGDYFTADTDFGFAPGETIKSAVWLHHRQPLETRDGGEIVVKTKIGTSTLSRDENGILIDAVLYNRKQYDEMLDALGWSSGTAAHLVEREKVGKSFWVKAWPLGLDASLTPSPAEPQNEVVPLKRLTQGKSKRESAKATVATARAEQIEMLTRRLELYKRTG